MIFINGKAIKPTIFPDKTSQVWKLDPEILSEKQVDVRWDFEEEGELVHLAQLKDLLDAHQVQSTLYLPYLPYARQDKYVSNMATFALRSFARLLNCLDFCKVVILDPHSEWAVRLIKNSEATYPFGLWLYAEKSTEANILAFPDKGASQKYSSLYPLGKRFVCGNKERDALTGEITEYQIVGDVKNKIVLIVDDICDGGATFVKLAHHLYAEGAKEVHLFVTHGLFSKGIEPLRAAGIKKIFTKHGDVV